MKPYKHQTAALKKCGPDNPAFAWLMEMGTGKTATDIWDTERLFKRDRIDGWIIVAPKGIYRLWLTKELPKFARFHYRAAIQSTGNKKAERLLVDELMQPQLLKDVLDILIINIESLHTKKAKECINQFFRSHKKVKTSIDESTKIKSHKAKRTQACWKIGHAAKYRRILTGFPYPQAPLDAYAQFYFLDPVILKYENWFAFRAHYAKMQTMKIGPQISKNGKKQKARSFKVIKGFRNMDELRDRVQAHSYRALKADCLDLPEKMYTKREVELTSEQEEIYKEVRDYGFAELDAMETVSVPIILTLIMRLQQIVAGHVTLDEGMGVKLLDNNRIQATLDTLEEISSKVVIWSHFVPSIENLVSAISGEYGPDAVDTYYGATPDKKRPEIIDRFQDPKSKLRFLVMNPATGGSGITVTAAHTNIYYTNSFNLEHRVQSEDRTHRIGQKESVLYVDLVSPDTVDEQVRDALVNKKQTATTALGESWQSWLQ